MKKPKVVLLIDGPDPDNYLALIAAISRFMCYELIAVIMVGRPVSAQMGALPYELNAHASRAVRRDNALHAKGILMRHGGESVPVFVGGFAPFSTVPQHLHIHERVTDVFDDAHAGHVLSGDIMDAVVYLSKFDGPIHVICGGPLTDLATLLTQPMLFGKLGIVVAQLGMFGFNPNVKTIAGKNRQFNVLADPSAVERVLRLCKQPFYFVPTDVTKDPDLAIHSADEIASLSNSSACREIAAMYRQAWPEMWGKFDPPIPAHAHDFHPAELMHYLLQLDQPHHRWFSPEGHDQIGRYTVSPFGIEHVPHQEDEQDRWGQIAWRPFEVGDPPRFLTDGCDNSQQRTILGTVLDAVGITSVSTSV